MTIAQALSDAGYATGMWGKWHLGSDPNSRSPVDFGFDEAVWCPRTADEVLWTMQSYFPEGHVTSAPYAGKAQIPLEPEPIYSRKKGSKAEVISTYDAEFRAGFDRKITDWAIDFMSRSKTAAKPFYMYLPYTQVHIPTIPDPEYAGKTRFELNAGVKSEAFRASPLITEAGIAGGSPISGGDYLRLPAVHRGDDASRAVEDCERRVARPSGWPTGAARAGRIAGPALRTLVVGAARTRSFLRTHSAGCHAVRASVVASEPRWTTV